MQGTREINFFARQKEAEYRENKTLEKRAVKIGTLGVIVIALAGGVGYYAWQSAKMQREIIRIDAFLNSPQVVQKFEDVRLKKQLLEVTQQYTNAIVSAGNRIQSYPDFDKKVLSDLEKRVGGSLVIQSIDYSNGHITLSCTTSDHNDIANFVYTLRRSPYIHDVQYTGYAKTTETTGVTDAAAPEGIVATSDATRVSRGYDTTIDIVLKPGGEINEAD